MKNSRKNGGIKIPERVYLLAPEDLIGKNTPVSLVIEGIFFRIEKQKKSKIKTQCAHQLNQILANVETVHREIFNQNTLFEFLVLEEIQVGLSMIIDMVKGVENEEDSNKKLKVVEAFLQSDDAEYVLDRCPELRAKINDYYDLLHNKVMKKEILKDVMTNLQDPLRSEEEKIKLKSLEAELVKYIKGLDKRIKDIEKQILDIIQNNPNCIP